MKTENMTFSEALEAMKQGYRVRRNTASWKHIEFICIESNAIVNNDGDIMDITMSVLDNDWEIYNEPKPELKFEIGELVMMRDSDTDMWQPKHFACIKEGKFNYQSMSGCWYIQCAKFDKDIVFTNKPAKK